MATNRTKRKVLRITLTTANILLIVGLFVFGATYFKKYQDIKTNPPSQQELDDARRARYIKEVGKLYNLPKDETPTLITVKDREQVKNQAFFAKAENGDIVLAYENSNIAILYRPSTRQIINSQAVSTKSDKTSIKVIGNQAEREAVEKYLNENAADTVSLVAGSDAKASYSGLVVVDVNGGKGDAAKQLADALKGQVGSLPAGEDKPEGVDILIIAGTTAP